MAKTRLMQRFNVDLTLLNIQMNTSGTACVQICMRICKVIGFMFGRYTKTFDIVVAITLNVLNTQAGC